MIADWRLVIGDWRLASLVTSHWRSSIVIEIARSHSHRASARCWLRMIMGNGLNGFGIVGGGNTALKRGENEMLESPGYGSVKLPSAPGLKSATRTSAS